VEPARSLFVDDSATNVEAAAALGYPAERFTSAAALRSRLVTEGVLTD
jgi:FMN phosphatase YigB (HAD superfamily)